MKGGTTVSELLTALLFTKHSAIVFLTIFLICRNPKQHAIDQSMQREYKFKKRITKHYEYHVGMAGDVDFVHAYN